MASPLPPVYSAVTSSRAGLAVPIFACGKAAHSKYDPRREAERLAQAVSPAGFFVVAGAAGGYFIEALHRRFPSSPIIAVEGTDKDIAFLAEHCPIVRSIMSSATGQIAIVPLSQAGSAITSRYIPALHGTLGILEWEVWASSNSGLLPQFREQIACAKKAASQDASTQARFGKIWQRNILLNVMFAAEHNCKVQRSSPRKVQRRRSRHWPRNEVSSGDRDSRKADLALHSATALIVAAGPSLDDAIEYIKTHRGELFVIAADTAFCALSRHGISSDAVVSIDGQQVSHEHFMAEGIQNTLFVMDLCTDSSAVRRIKALGGRISFVRTGHPLSSLLAPSLPLLDAGGGTVAIAACDWARLMGFSRIAVAGADFAYIGGKAYASGTYLDALYSVRSSRLFSTETAFASLLFRTPLYPASPAKPCAFTTPVLKSYSVSFEAWLARHEYKQKALANGVRCYETSRPQGDLEGGFEQAIPPNAHGIRIWIEEAKEALAALKTSSPLIPPAVMALLPCAAYFQAHETPLPASGTLRESKCGGEASLQKALNLAIKASLMLE